MERWTTHLQAKSRIDTSYHDTFDLFGFGNIHLAHDVCLHHRTGSMGQVKSFESPQRYGTFGLLAIETQGSPTRLPPRKYHPESLTAPTVTIWRDFRLSPLQSWLHPRNILGCCFFVHVGLYTPRGNGIDSTVARPKFISKTFDHALNCSF